MDEPTFDIFRGADKDPAAVWIAAVEGLSNACKRMEEIARANPGQYFISERLTHSVLAKVDSRKSEPSLKRKAQSA